MLVKHSASRQQQARDKATYLSLSHFKPFAAINSKLVGVEGIEPPTSAMS